MVVMNEWLKQLGTPSQDGTWEDGVAIDGSGNVYLAGYTAGSLGGPQAGNGDAFLAKYNPSGNLLWTRQLGTPQYEWYENVATDGFGNVYISGATYGSLGGPLAGADDAFLAKYDPNGTLLWKRQLGGPSWDGSRSVATDSSGNAYIVGETGNSLGGPLAGIIDAWIGKYDPNGTLLWTKQLGTTAYDGASDVTVDSSGNIYISGWTEGSLGGTSAGGIDAWVAKYNPSGTLLWTQQLGTSGDDQSWSIATDATGNVYLTGFTSGNLGGMNAGGYDAWVAKYNASGTRLWTKQLGTSVDDKALGIAATGSGKVYISGWTNGSFGGTSAGGQDGWLAVYDTNGNLLETQQVGTASNDDANSVAVDSGSHIYLAGTTSGSLGGANAGNGDAWVAKYNVELPTFGNSTYYLTTATTWANAEAQAVAMGGHLVTVNSLQEHQFLLNTFDREESFWIGLTDQAQEGVFHWISGEPVTFTNWASTEPNNVNNEDYTAMNQFQRDAWNDLNGTALLRGIVEISPTITLAVTPSSVAENGTNQLVYTFTRQGLTTSSLTVNYTVGGTATFNSDYTQTGAATFTNTNGTVTFAAGADTVTVTIDPAGDTTIESNETVILTLAAGAGYTIGITGTVTGTIANDDIPNQIHPIAATGTGNFNGSPAILIDKFVPAETTGWTTNGQVVWSDHASPNPQYTIDLGGLYQLEDLTVSVDNNDNYVVQYSTDNVTYSNLCTILSSYGNVNPVPGGMDTMTTIVGDPQYVAGMDFTAVKARYLRIFGTLGDQQYAVGEVMPFGHLIPSRLPSGYVHELAKLNPNDPNPNNPFANSVGISGNFTIAGSPFDDAGGQTDSGSAYLFQQQGNHWTQVAKLTASDGEAGDKFGSDVAMGTDVAIAGSPNDDQGGTDKGAVYIFQKQGGTWQQITKLLANDTTAQGFGTSVAIDGNTMIVGSGDNIDNRGAAYIFQNQGGTWQKTGKLLASDGAFWDYFGIPEGSVDIDGDTAIVGSYADDVGSNPDQGSAYIFQKIGGTWQQMAKLTASDGKAYEFFGKSVSIDGDTVLISCVDDGDSGVGGGSGAAYIFQKIGGTWQQTAKLTASDAALNADFGSSVALEGNKAIISSSNTGKSYTFQNYNGTWQQTAILTATDGGWFSSVAIDGNTAIASPYIFTALNFTVNSTGDAGDVNPGDGVALTADGVTTLRAALEEANASAGTQTIVFNIPTTDPGYNPTTGTFAIKPLSSLPTITDAVVIDGTTQPGFSNKPIIELDGSSAGNSNGLIISAGDSTVRGLVVNRFLGNGIVLNIKGNNIIEGNYIGTDVTGSLDYGNDGSGILVQTSNNRIGGIQAGERNVISGSNIGAGIYVVGSSGNQILGNYIGTDVTGAIAIGNLIDGVLIDNAPNTIIGGTEPGARNVISGNNSNGVEIIFEGSTGTRILGNYIGTNASGTASLGNTGNGISIGSNANDIIIGGTEPGAGNLISGNNLSGVLITGVTSQGNSQGNQVLENSIFGNGGLGIDLANGVFQGNGVTPNDLGDGDTGANNLQNYPVLTSAVSIGGNTNILGTFNSNPNNTFRLEFFANAALDPSGYGEGHTFLGTGDVTTDASGNASLNITFPVAVPLGQFITATATNQTTHDTSEFSAGRIVNSFHTINGTTGNDTPIGTPYNDVINGLGGNDSLTGGAGNDTLNGGTGNDTLIGGLGNDTYLVDSTADVVTETSTLATEIDTIKSSVSRTLGANLERLTLTGTDNLNGTGNSLNNRLTGNSGNNILNGGTGNDTLIGGLGNDTYLVDSTADVVTETSTLATEIDTIKSSVSRTLGANLERLTLTGTDNLNGTGNSLNNRLTGNSGNNILNGGTGNDTLIGGLGNDTLVGGVGNDTLTGGTGSDRFTFNSGTEGIDRLIDFSVIDDTIAVSATGFGGGLQAGVLSSEQFVPGTTASDDNDRFIYNQSNGKLFFDADGLGGIPQIQIATLSSWPELDAQDLVVI